jgi:hypothetical protein
MILSRAINHVAIERFVRFDHPLERKFVFRSLPPCSAHRIPVRGTVQKLID